MRPYSVWSISENRKYHGHVRYRTSDLASRSEALYRLSYCGSSHTNYPALLLEVNYYPRKSVN